MIPEKKKCTAILLSAGTGSRMGSSVAKQYMDLCGKPVIWYGLRAFEQSPLIDECILVVGAGDISFAEKEIVEKYGFTKVRAVIEGGSERCFSVKNAVDRVTGDGYVFIHDGARPLLTEEIIRDTYEAAVECGACCAAVPVKDTIKIADEADFAKETPNRNYLYAVQTPQVFSAPLIREAYTRMEQQYDALLEKGIRITDDAMVVEQLMGQKVKLVKSSYENIKITTPEDLEVAACFLNRRR